MRLLSLNVRLKTAGGAGEESRAPPGTSRALTPEPSGFFDGSYYFIFIYLYISLPIQRSASCEL